VGAPWVRRCGAAARAPTGVAAVENPSPVLPLGLAELLLVTPSGWSLTESSREVRLPAPK